MNTSTNLSTVIRQTIADLVWPEGREQRDVLTRAADTDALTSLANRRALDRALPEAERDARWRVVVFDINNFGVVNKLAGHEAGDRLLVEIASCIRRVAEGYGFGERAFRRGGDEFVLLAPVSLAETLCAQVEMCCGRKLVTRGSESIEVSIAGSVGETFEDADARLQIRKRQVKGDG